LREVLGEKSLHKLAIQTGFCKRKSKLSPEVFFDLLFFASSRSHNRSLEHLVSHLSSRHDIDIQKQSLDERFTEKTVLFVKTVLRRLIEVQFSDWLNAKKILACLCENIEAT
jgi:hypothetical protein